MESSDAQPNREKAVGRRLRRLSKTEQNFEDVIDYLIDAKDSGGHGSDRLVALLAATMIETGLEHRLREKMIDDLPGDISEQIFASDRNGSLSSFGAKIYMGRALGIFGPKAFADLKKINLIRNAFAHSMHPLHFEFPEIQELCDQLDQHLIFPWETTGKVRAFLESPTSTPKYRFIHASIAIATVFAVHVEIDTPSGKYKRKPLP